MTSGPPEPPAVRVRVERDGAVTDDWAVVEAPLEIRVDGEALAVTLRTPGHDHELVAGLLLAEGIVSTSDQLETIESVVEPGRPGAIRAVGALLREGHRLDRERLRERQRTLLVSAACGACGAPTLDGLRHRLRPVEAWEPPDEVVRAAPGRMRERQEVFARTGGIHAAALFDGAGEMLLLREDVGRHNAVDKVVGRAFLDGAVPLRRRLLAVSGRAGFEIVQKAVAAGIPALASVGAASSLAIALAREAGMTLFSFVRPEGRNRH